MESAVVTFDRHPAAVVRPESAPRLLTDLDQKLELLAATGRRPVPRDHLRRGPVEGAGRGLRAGGARRLPRRQGRDRGRGLPLRPPAQGQRRPARRDGRRPRLRGRGPRARRRRRRRRPATRRRRRPPRSATRSSRATSPRANALLGRPHEVRGVVAHGDQRGRELGFPTANVSVPGDILLPADGIYAGWYERPDGIGARRRAISLGRRPTFYEEAHASLLEAHLLDFDGDLYGEPAKVRFVAAAPRRGEVRRRRGPGRADPARLRRRPARDPASEPPHPDPARGRAPAVRADAVDDLSR